MIEFYLILILILIYFLFLCLFSRPFLSMALSLVRVTTARHVFRPTRLFAHAPGGALFWTKNVRSTSRTRSGSLVCVEIEKNERSARWIDTNGPFDLLVRERIQHTYTQANNHCCFLICCIVPLQI